ncbi:UDP-galactopyranose mutase [Megamonas hypermegale]|uniref:UDP-galactopyranose mutase n=1 Tax=Megamonas hypermegale TaxID=158847 RepID=UPI0026EB043C|nr:UDP-galactopyranose mutase [Megamonas hypermegale]
MEALVIGCGLTGSVIARFLAEKLNKKVVIWDRRNHVGGNMYDYYDEQGILVHKYGPHTFHTKKKYLYDYMCRFAEWKEYKLTCMAQINGKFTPTPFNFQTIDDFYDKKEAADLKKRIRNEFGNKATATVVEVLNCNDEKIKKYAQFLFDNDYSLYTAKQWGISANEVDPSILKRVPLRFSYDIGYFDDEYQVMPATTFTDFFKSLLNHKNIEIKLSIEALEHLNVDLQNNKVFIDGEYKDIPIIYTGALDELFDNCYGKLPYRSLRFEWKYEDIDSKQDAPVVAYPQAEGFTRITEYKKLPVQDVKGTTYAVEYPLSYNENVKMEPYYPVLTEKSQRIYSKYLEKASNIKNLFLAGRLADFKYYNMDQALERALNICKELN